VAPPAHHGTLPEQSGESDIPPAVRVSEAPADIALAETPATPTGVTEVAKTPRRPAPGSETSLSPQPVSLKPDQVETLLPGVSVSIQEPSADAKMPAPPATSSTQAVPSQLPMPPEATGSLPLRQAAAGGDAKAQYAIALRYAEGEGVAQSWTEAARWLGFAASSGLAPAQYRLAVLIERGQGVAKDAGQAGSWYARAAEQGNIKAMHNLGVAAGEGRSGKPDYAVAAKWYAQAAAYGLADSQFNLAILEEHGLGLDKNLPEAFMWFSLAAANGDAEAAKRRDLVKQELAPAALSQAEQALKAWTAKPASPEANEVVMPASEQADAGSSNKTLIARAQTLLNKLGYDVGVPDGELGDRTRDGIKSFERRNGMTETGEVTVPLVTKLERLTG
jgi:localization factor PodJL